VFFLVVASTFQVVVPFFVFEDATFATHVSIAIAIVMMFVAGYGLGRYAGARPWRIGLAMVVVGSALVAMIIALGG
jgi:VIT1/CCC1 family predicted Fe2+/Mn2+ transporter